MLSRQKELPVESMEYSQLMTNMEILARTSDMYSDIADFFSLADQGIQKIEFFPDGKEVSEPYVEEPKQFETEAAQVSSGGQDTNADETTPEKDTNAAPEKTYEMAEVRAALVAARRRGVNVTELLKEYGVDNFGAFPAGKYGELMKRLEG